MLKKSEPQSLEIYLAQIERELRDLPSQARADEMREIEAHLAALIEQRGDVAGVLVQFGKPCKVGRDLRRAWERKQSEKWWRAVAAPFAGALTFIVSSLICNPFVAYLDDTMSPAWLDPIYLYPSLCLLMMVFFAGFAIGVVSPKRGFLPILAYFVYSIYLIFTLPQALDRAKVPGENTMGVIAIFFLVGLIMPVVSLIGIYFGARRSRRISAFAKIGGHLFLAQIANGRRSLNSVAGEKLNVPL